MADTDAAHIAGLVNGIAPNLTKPCQLHHHDYRSTPHPTSNPTQPIRLIQFNIERGYKLTEIVSLLQSLIRSDQHVIISLQEIDIHCQRSYWHNTGTHIAQALHLNYIFLCEFEEVYSDQRSERNQGGGIHGNAILTTFDIESHHVIKHAPQYDWLTKGDALGEPRRGDRCTLRIAVQHNNRLFNIYNTHFEIFCGISHRLEALADIFDDIREQLDSRQIESVGVLGDLNSQAHGIARLSSKYCTDWMRLTTLGHTEAEWLSRYVFNYVNTDHSNDSLLWEYGLTKLLCQRLINPRLSDPYDVYNDVTLHSHHGLYQGKLDWMLLRYCTVKHQSIHNMDYHASDHRLLCCDVELSDSDTYQPMELKRPWPGVLTCTTVPVLTQLPTLFIGILLAWLSQWLLNTYVL